MLDLIIETSSEKGSIVLDCFCGSGTTLKSAHELGRTWIGIDESEIALKAAMKKLETVANTLFTNEMILLQELKFGYLNYNIRFFRML